MIAPTKRRLNIIFTSVLIGFNLFLLGAVITYFHQSLQFAVREHLDDEVLSELVPLYRAGNLGAITALHESDHFQWLNRKGEVVLATQNSTEFHLPVNPVLLQEAIAGHRKYERATLDEETFMVAYYPQNEDLAIRASGSMALLERYERIFIIGALVGLPVCFLLAFVFSRYMVNQAMQPIEEVSTYQETFSSNVTHELMSPLTSLRGNLEVALRRPREAAEYEETLRLGLGEVERVIDLLNNLYLLASSRFRPLDLFRERTDLSDLVAQRVEQARPHADERSIALEVAGEGPAWCNCDASLIRRTVDNLIDNAVKYAPAGSRVALRVGSYGEWNILEVANPSERPPAESPERLFEPFERGGQAGGPVLGKGLGLYISRYIARSHGGDLRINAAAEGQFSVALSLPAAGPGSADPP